MSLMVILVAVLVIAAIVGVGVAAVYFGLEDRSTTERQAAEQHYQKGLAHLQAQEYELASAEFDLTLQLDPKHLQAREKRDQTQQTLEAQPTATPMLQKEVKDAYFEELRAAYERQDWTATFAQADRLLALDAAYQRAAVDQMLYVAFYQSGLDLVQQDRVREAVRLYDRALDIRPDSPEVTRAKHIANLYLTAMSYWGADWSKAIENLSTVYGLDSGFRDVKDRLYTAHLNYAEQLGEQQEWCLAADEYTAALTIMADTAVTAARQQAQAQCQSGSTKPTVDEGGQAQLPPAPDLGVPSGAFYGHLAEPTGIEKTKMFMRGRVFDARGEAVQGAQIKIQAWDWSAIAVTDGQGQYAFDGLSNAVTYTLTVLDVDSVPFEVLGEWGQVTWVNFYQAK